MTALLLLTLLVGTPVQDSVTADRFGELESRVNELEKRIVHQEAREESFQSILSGQRWTFLIGVTFITILATALFGFVGWGIFEWRAGKIEEGVDDKIKNLGEDVEDNRDYFESEIRDIGKRVWRQEVASRQQKMFHYEDMELNQPVMSSAAYLIEKIAEEDEGFERLRDILSLAINRINNVLKKENNVIHPSVYEQITDTIDRIIDERDDVPDNLLRLREVFRDKVTTYQRPEG